MDHPSAPETPAETFEPRLVHPAGQSDLSAMPAFLRDHDGRGDATAPSTEVASRDQSEATRESRSVHVPRPDPVTGPDPGALPMAGISPRRLLQVVAIVVLALGVVSFGRQVATASSASAHADALRASNAALEAQVGAMQRELKLIQEGRYIDQQARAFRLGTVAEVPFALEVGASPLPEGAPGSAAVRLGLSRPEEGRSRAGCRSCSGPADRSAGDLRAD